MLTVTASDPAHYHALISAFAAACGTGGALCADRLDKILTTHACVESWPDALERVRRANAWACADQPAQSFQISEGSIGYLTSQHDITLSCDDGAAEWRLVVESNHTDDSDRMRAAVDVLARAGLSDLVVDQWRLEPMTISIHGLTEAQSAAALAAYGRASADERVSDTQACVYPEEDVARYVAQRNAAYAITACDLQSLALEVVQGRIPGQVAYAHGLTVTVRGRREDGAARAEARTDHSVLLAIQPGEWTAPRAALARLMELGVERAALDKECNHAWTDSRTAPRPLTAGQVTALIG